MKEKEYLFILRTKTTYMSAFVICTVSNIWLLLLGIVDLNLFSLLTILLFGLLAMGSAGSIQRTKREYHKGDANAKKD